MAERLILASQSASRQEMLKNAGLKFEVIPANLDERAIEEKFSGDPQRVTRELARQKAIAIADQNIDALVIGSDSTVDFRGQCLSKANNKQEALEKLMMLSGRTHHLISSVSVAKGRTIMWDATEVATLTMRKFDEAFARDYLEKIGDAATSCVGAYQLEALGPWLFEKIEGDYFTILGLPLVKLLSYLQDYHGLKL